MAVKRSTKIKECVSVRVATKFKATGRVKVALSNKTHFNLNAITVYHVWYFFFNSIINKKYNSV